MPLYKGSGATSDLDNWRGICLLQFLSKVVATLVNNVLSKASEAVLDEGQCGFRRFRGCPDATFTLRRLFEEVRATKPAPGDVTDRGMFSLFVDLRKAFYSVPRAAIWKVLRAVGVPEGLIAMTEDFHKGMGSNIKHRGFLSERFPMPSGGGPHAVGFVLPLRIG